MKTIDIVFNYALEFSTGAAANQYGGKTYAYLITDEQAQQIIDNKIEFAVVVAPTDQGQLKVVKIVGEPSSDPMKATRHIVCLVDMATYISTKERAAAIKKIKARMEQRAAEIAEEMRLKALADSGDPVMKALLEELEGLK